MNKKEAEQVIKDLSVHPGLQETAMAHYSKGYLEAVSQVAPMIDSLEKISKVTQFDHPKSQIIGSEEYEGAWLDCVELAEKALAKWREIQGEHVS